MFGSLRGNFATVVWDQTAKRMVAARDCMGIRPLYYVASKEYLAIASDPEQMLAARLTSRTVDREMVLDYLLWDARFTDRTFFQEIRALPGGHLLIAEEDRCNVRRFSTQALDGVRLPSQSEYWKEYRRRFFDSVSTCIRSHAPVVLELSGGLDSSSIVCAADKIAHEYGAAAPELIAAAGRYPGLACDETPFISAVAERIRIPVECWDATRNSVNELDSTSIAVPGGRYFTFAGTEGQIEIMLARRATVLVSGLGGDQIGISAGAIRDAVTELRWQDAARMIFRWPRADARFTARIMLALVRSFSPPSVRVLSHRYGPIGARPFWLSRWARNYRRLRPDPYYPASLESEVHRRNWRAISSGPHALSMMYLQHYAVRRDIDIRFPFLDLDLVSLALSVPARYWPPPWPCERLHRGILGDLLPTAVFERRTKANFQAALDLRVRRHLPGIRDLVMVGPWLCEEFVDRGGARRLLEMVEKGDANDLGQIHGLWAVATLEAWMRGILGYAPARHEG